MLELGGSDPFIVMPSADLDAGGRAPRSRRGSINNGQSCIAAKRFIVHESIADEFERRFVAGMAALKVGDPMDPATDIGPLATESQLQTIADQVERAVAAGARVLTGGRRLDRPGYYYAPTVLDRDHARLAGLPRRGVRPGGAAVPGPHVPTRPSALANDSPFGLGASAWTRSDAERERFVAGDRGRHGVRQRDGGLGSAGAVRRGEAVAATGGSWVRWGSGSS